MKTSAEKKKQKKIPDNGNQQERHFSEDKFFHHVFKVSIYLLLFRIGYTFLFAMLMGESWYIRWMWDWVPIINFTSAPQDFANLNSYSLLAMAATELLIFIVVIVKKRRDVQYKFWAWYMGIMMTVVQYGTLLWLSKRVQFGIRDDLWIPLVAFALIATLLVYFFKKRIYTRAKELNKAPKIEK